MIQEKHRNNNSNLMDELISKKQTASPNNTDSKYFVSPENYSSEKEDYSLEQTNLKNKITNNIFQSKKTDIFSIFLFFIAGVFTSNMYLYSSNYEKELKINKKSLELMAELDSLKKTVEKLDSEKLQNISLPPPPSILSPLTEVPKIVPFFPDPIIHSKNDYSKFTTEQQKILNDMDFYNLKLKKELEITDQESDLYKYKVQNDMMRLDLNNKLIQYQERINAEKRINDKNTKN